MKTPELYEAQKEHIWDLSLAGYRIREIANITGATIQEVNQVLNEGRI